MNTEFQMYRRVDHTTVDHTKIPYGKLLGQSWSVTYRINFLAAFIRLLRYGEIGNVLTIDGLTEKQAKRLAMDKNGEAYLVTYVV